MCRESVITMWGEMKTASSRPPPPSNGFVPVTASSQCNCLQPATSRFFNSISSASLLLERLAFTKANVVRRVRLGDPGRRHEFVAGNDHLSREATTRKKTKKWKMKERWSVVIFI